MQLWLSHGYDARTDPMTLFGAEVGCATPSGARRLAGRGVVFSRTKNWNKGIEVRKNSC